jgi:membrane peptidoglycan carboxypeptidase
MSDERQIEVIEEPTGQHEKPAPLPARLPANSRAAAAQRLEERPEKPPVGVYYAAPHLVTHPRGWRLKRHFKRKNLHRSNLRYALVDKIGTQWTLMPLALVSLAVIVVLSSVLVGVAGLVNATQQRFENQVVTLADILPKDSLKMYDAEGDLIYQMTSDGLQTTVPLSQISVNLQHAEIAIEDQNFWNNPGYDITGIIRAALADLTHGRIVSGGSTITQQLIKNTIVGNRDTIIRKLQEIILAPQVTRYYTKQQILSMYLNTVYYGEQAYGAEAAAFTYFGLKDTPTRTAAAQLDIAQSAMLAGIPSSPIARDPFVNWPAAFQRAKDVLNQMYVQGYITSQQERAAIVEMEQPHFLHRGVVHNNPNAPHFITYALNELAQVLHVKVPQLARSGLVVHTTLDLSLQKQVFAIARKHIQQMAGHNMSDAAVVVLDPHTGAIRTLVGNIHPNDPQTGQFDVATQGYRQPGSSFKPFIYATAFSQGVSPGMPVYDGPLTIQMCCGLPPYTPHNYDQSYHGLISFRYALQNSFNIPAVKLLLKTGVSQSLHTAQVMGISSYVGTPNYTMVLGTLGVHLLDMTSAYGVFDNGGVRVPAHAIDTVTDPQGQLIYRFVPQGKRVISRQVAFLVTNVLSDNNNRTYEFGKCSALYLYSNTQQQCYAGNPGVVRPAAAKTGTSQDFMDNWTIGYTPDVVVGVWAGNDDNSPMINVTGVDGAGPIWHDTMLLVEKGKPVEQFPGPPPGVVKKTVSYPGITTTDWYIVHNGI